MKEILRHWAFDIASAIILFIMATVFRGFKKGELKMLEGKELEGNIGNIGHYSVDADDHGYVEVAVGIKLDVLGYLKQLAAKTNTPIDDKAVEWIESILRKKEA